MENELKTVVIAGDAVKALGDGKVGGYLVRFSGPKDPDLTGDFFTAKTDFGGAQRSEVYYQHGMDDVIGKRVLGSADIKYDDIGAWVEAQLELRDDYEREIYKLAEAGKLGWSSGTAGHLVDREQIGKAYWIKKWPLGLDASLTPTPAEPRNAAITIKLLDAESQDAEPEPEAEAVVDGVEAEEEAPVSEIVTESQITQEEEKMDENLKSEIAALVSETVQASMKALADEAPVNSAAPAVKKVTELGFSEDATKGFVHWVKTGHKNGALIEAKGAWQGQTDNEGGYLVPDDFYARVVEKRDLMSWVRQAPVTRFTTNRDRILIPTESTAATKMVLTAEEGAADENEPVFGQAVLNIHNFTKLIKASDELMSDEGANLEAYISSTFARAAAKAENYYLTVGSGSSEPQGVLTGATSSSITTAGATAITAAEIVSLRGKLGSAYHVPGEVGWMMQFATKNYIQGITGNPFNFISTPAGNADSMLSYPFYVSDDMEALAATKKAVLIGNFSFYAFAERQGMMVQRNPYLYMANGQVGLFASVRFGGVVLQSEAFQYMTQHS